VKFRLNDDPFSLENVMPYALGGDLSGDYFALSLGSGMYELKAIPFSGSNATGSMGNSLTINFSIIHGAAAPASPLRGNSPTAEPTGPLPEGLRVYPNPSQGYFTLEFGDVRAGELRLQILNTAGALMLQQTFSTEGGPWSKQIDISQLPAGIYLLEVQSGEQRFQQKMVKMK